MAGDRVPILRDLTKSSIFKSINRCEPWGLMMNTEEAARAFKALGDENRLRIARIVAERGDV